LLLEAITIIKKLVKNIRIDTKSFLIYCCVNKFL
jgi:hypothetical protein